MRLVLFSLVLALGLAGCGDDIAPNTEPRVSATPTPTLPPTPYLPPTLTPTPTASTTPGVVVVYRCEGQRYETMQDAWLGAHFNCIDTSAQGVPNQRERSAVRLAYGKRATARDVGILYGACGANNADWPLISAGDTNSAEWAQERRGAVLLCPDHPHVNQLAAALAATDTQVERDKNRMTDGTHLVGTDVRPGTWAATPSGSCYWERTDANGNIIDNNFSNGARAQFTVASSDYSVSVQGCGAWQRVR